MKHDRAEAAVPGWRNQPLVLEPDERQTRSLGHSMAVLALAFVPALVYVVETGKSNQVAYQATTAQVEYEALAKVERELAAERARLESLREIEVWAMEQRGLCRPAPEEVEVVRSEGPGADTFFARAPGGPRGAAGD